MANNTITYLDDKHRKMREYGKAHRERKKLAKRAKAEHKPLRNVPVSFIKSIQPTRDNFQGTDIDEPIVCSTFGCKNHLTPEHQLYGNKCQRCQSTKKTDITTHLQYPHKRSA